MSLRHVTRDDGAEAVLDDMPPVARAVAVLIDHANNERDAGRPGPCRCAECVRYRLAVVARIHPDGSLSIEAAP